jgi:hypothetical protein
VRLIIEGPYFAKCVEELGGYRAVDRALEAVIDGLVNNPYGFPLVENDWCHIRYARTKTIEGYIPTLLVAFVIDENGNVILEWIEAIDEAELPDQ